MSRPRWIDITKYVAIHSCPGHIACGHWAEMALADEARLSRMRQAYRRRRR